MGIYYLGNKSSSINNQIEDHNRRSKMILLAYNFKRYKEVRNKKNHKSLESLKVTRTLNEETKDINFSFTNKIISKRSYCNQSVQHKNQT